MHDATLVRFVDGQRAQARWLIGQLECERDNIAKVEGAALSTALVRVIHHSLTGYFAELTQKRYAPDLWFALLGCAGSFRRMRRVATCEDHVVSRWLNLEVEADSCLCVAISAIARIGVPEVPQYRSSLLTDTSLTEAKASPAVMIASSSSEGPPTLHELALAWSEIEALILSERNQGLEC